MFSRLKECLQSVFKSSHKTENNPLPEEKSKVQSLKKFRPTRLYTISEEQVSERLCLKMTSTESSAANLEYCSGVCPKCFDATATHGCESPSTNIVKYATKSTPNIACGLVLTQMSQSRSTDLEPCLTRSAPNIFCPFTKEKSQSSITSLGSRFQRSPQPGWEPVTIQLFRSPSIIQERPSSGSQEAIRESRGHDRSRYVPPIAEPSPPRSTPLTWESFTLNLPQSPSTYFELSTSGLQQQPSVNMTSNDLQVGHSANAQQPLTQPSWEPVTIELHRRSSQSQDMSSQDVSSPNPRELGAVQESQIPYLCPETTSKSKRPDWEPVTIQIPEIASTKLELDPMNSFEKSMELRTAQIDAGFSLSPKPNWEPVVLQFPKTTPSNIQPSSVPSPSVDQEQQVSVDISQHQIPVSESPSPAATVFHKWEPVTLKLSYTPISNCEKPSPKLPPSPTIHPTAVETPSRLSPRCEQPSSGSTPPAWDPVTIQLPKSLLSGPGQSAFENSSPKLCELKTTIAGPLDLHTSSGLPNLGSPLSRFEPVSLQIPLDLSLDLEPTRGYLMPKNPKPEITPMCMNPRTSSRTSSQSLMLSELEQETTRTPSNGFAGSEPQLNDSLPDSEEPNISRIPLNPQASSKPLSQKLPQLSGWEPVTIPIHPSVSGDPESLPVGSPEPTPTSMAQILSTNHDLSFQESPLNTWESTQMSESLPSSCEPFSLKSWTHSYEPSTTHATRCHSESCEQSTMNSPIFPLSLTSIAATFGEHTVFDAASMEIESELTTLGSYTLNHSVCNDTHTPVNENGCGPIDVSSLLISHHSSDNNLDEVEDHGNESHSGSHDRDLRTLTLSERTDTGTDKCDINEAPNKLLHGDEELMTTNEHLERDPIVENQSSPGTSYERDDARESAIFQVQKSLKEAICGLASSSNPNSSCYQRDNRATYRMRQYSDDSPDLSEPSGRNAIPQAGPSSMPMPNSYDNKRLKFLLPVETRKQTPPPMGALSRQSSLLNYPHLSPSPPPEEDGVEDDDEEEIQRSERGGREDRRRHSLIGDDGLLDVFALRQDCNQRLSGLNRRFRKYRARQDTVRRLLNYIQHLIRETETMNAMMASSGNQIEVLAKEASSKREELAAVCDIAVTTVGKVENQIQRLEPACYKRYLNIRNENDCANLLMAVRNKKKALADLELLIQRKQIVQKNALPVTVNDTPAIKTSKKASGGIGAKKSKFNKLSSNKNVSTIKPIFLEIINSTPPESGSNSTTTDTSAAHHAVIGPMLDSAAFESTSL